MNEILNSATKITLLLLIIAMTVGLFMGKIESNDFMTVVMVVVSFYFGQKALANKTGTKK